MAVTDHLCPYRPLPAPPFTATCSGDDDGCGVSGGSFKKSITLAPQVGLR